MFKHLFGVKGMISHMFPWGTGVTMGRRRQRSQDANDSENSKAEREFKDTIAGEKIDGMAPLLHSG